MRSLSAVLIGKVFMGSSWNMVVYIFFSKISSQIMKVARCCAAP